MADHLRSGLLRAIDGELLRKAKLRLDGLVNLVTGFGTARDKLQSGRFTRQPLLTDEELDALFTHDDLSRRIVTEKPAAALRNGFSMKRNGATPTEDERRRLLEELKRWQVVKKLLEAKSWGRLYGEGALFTVYATELQETPIDIEGKARLLDLIVLDKRDYTAVQTDAWYSEPELYQLNTVGLESAVGAHIIHKSRLIRFGGALTSRRERRSRGWVDHSVLQAPYDAIRSFHSAWAAADNRLMDSSQGVFKVKGLFEMISQGDTDLLQKRMEVVDLGRSAARSIILDADDEDFSYVEAGFAGIGEMTEQRARRIAMATGYPRSVLFGDPQSGLSQGTTADRLWVQQLVIEQEEMHDPLELLVNLIASQAGLGDGWQVEFVPPWTYTPEELAEHRKAVAESDAIYVSMGALLAEEVAVTRFGSDDGFFREVQVDLDLRNKLLEAAQKREEEKAERPTPEPPVLPPQPPQQPPPAAEPDAAAADGDEDDAEEDEKA